MPIAEPTESLPGQPSLTFSGRIGRTYPAAAFPKQDLLIDPQRFDSEGNWAFCRFASEEVPAVRMGFQRGGFNIGTAERQSDRDLLQLHLEVMGRDGARLWLPTGRFPASGALTDPQRLEVQLNHGGQEIFRISGWPDMEWRFRSEEGELEVELRVAIETVTVLPDCLLPRCVFSMWETMGSAQGTVRIGSRKVPVDGKVFYDHPRIVPAVNAVAPRKMYLYTTMYFEDGSGMFGYHAVDERDQPIPYYCFGVYIDPTGQGTFLPVASTPRLEIGTEKMPTRWSLDWRGDAIAVQADITVQHLPLAKAWGSPAAPRQRSDFIIFPLVLDGSATLTAGGRTRRLAGYGLAEYFNAEHWPA